MFSSHAPSHLEAFSILFSENQSNKSWVEVLQATKMIRVLTDAAEVFTFLGGVCKTLWLLTPKLTAVLSQSCRMLAMCRHHRESRLDFIETIRVFREIFSARNGITLNWKVKFPGKTWLRLLSPCSFCAFSTSQVPNWAPRTR